MLAMAVISDINTFCYVSRRVRSSRYQGESPLRWEHEGGTVNPKPKAK